MSVGTVCACGARGEHANCPARRSAAGYALPHSATDDMREAVLGALPAASANAVARRIARQRSAVLEAVRELVADGEIVKTAAGLQATGTPHGAGVCAERRRRERCSLRRSHTRDCAGRRPSGATVSPLAKALLAELDDDALDELARLLAPRLAAFAPPPAGDAWLNAKQAAAHLGISVSRLHKLTAARAIPFVQDTPGGRCKFKRSELDRWRETRAA